MKQVREIVKQDLLNLKRVPLVALLLLGLAFLPSLYAWFNIAASWDPYSNTEGIKIAVVNEDVGTMVDDESLDIGDQLVENLEENEQMGWVFTDREEAEEGVRSGIYYASVYIDEDFSEQLMSVLDGAPHPPQVRYEVNEKLNAIAPKMTSAGASAVVDQISEQFLGEASKALFTQLNTIGIELENELPTIQRVEDLLFELEDRFPEINELGTRIIDLRNNWPEINDKLNQLIDLQERFPEINQGASHVLTLEDHLPSIHSIADRVEELDEAIPQIEEAAGQIVSIGNRFGALEQEFTTALELIQAAEEAITTAQDALPFVAATADNVERYAEGMTTILGELESAVDPLVNVIGQQAQFVEQGANTFLSVLERVEAGEPADALLEPLQAVERLLETNETALTDAVDFLTELNDAAPANELNDLLLTVTSLRDDVQRLQSGVQQASVALETAGELDPATVNQLREQAEAAKAGAEAVQAQLDSGAGESLKNAFVRIQSETVSLADNIAEMEGRLPDLESMLDQAASIRLTGEEQLTALLDEFPAIEERIQTGVTLIENELANVVGGIEGIHAFMENDFPTIEERIHQASHFIQDDLPGLEEQFISMAEIIDMHLPEFEDALSQVASFAEIELPDLEDSVQAAADRVREFEENNDLEEMISLLKNDIEAESAFFREPVQLQEEQLYPIPNYGSANAPFYTALSLWVGSLLLVNLLKTDVHPTDMRAHYKIHHVYLGRLVLFLIISFLQGTIVSIGNLLILGTYAVHPIWFIVFTILTGMVFMTIVYTLASVFANIGKALAIIFMVLQLSGAGGTFPIQVAPSFFQAINPFLPFTYAINLLREGVAGIVPKAVFLNVGMLLGFFVAALVFGLLLKKPLAKRMAATSEKSRSSRMID